MTAEVTSILRCVLMLYLFHSVRSQSITIQRSVQNNGFHRDLVTKVTIPIGIFDNAVDLSKCRCLLIETLPSSVYVDPFQLTQYLQFGGPEFISPEVDIEKPEYLSAAFNISIFTQPLELISGYWVTNVTLPVHIRYHRPSSDPSQYYQQVTVPDPDVYINCSDNSNSILNTEEITAPCDRSNSKLCIWKSIDYKSDSDVVNMLVPIGKNNHLLVVILGTLIVTLGSCIVITKSITGIQKDKKLKMN